MTDPTSMEDLQVLADRALSMHAPNAVHQDTIARAKRLVPLIDRTAMPPDAPVRDAHGSAVGA